MCREVALHHLFHAVSKMSTGGTPKTHFSDLLRYENPGNVQNIALGVWHVHRMICWQPKCLRPNGMLSRNRKKIHRLRVKRLGLITQFEWLSAKLLQAEWCHSIRLHDDLLNNKDLIICFRRVEFEKRLLCWWNHVCIGWNTDQGQLSAP